MILSRFYPIFLLTAALGWFSCQSFQESEEHENLDEKTAPYDFFSQQRSYPDRDFDWKGWRKTLQRVRQVETQELRSNGC
ncbi:MAG: hypothetical protein ABIQ93_14370, partial [Saprospiraceae bacterium]